MEEESFELSIPYIDENGVQRFKTAYCDATTLDYIRYLEEVNFALMNDNAELIEEVEYSNLLIGSLDSLRGN